MDIKQWDDLAEKATSFFMCAVMVSIGAICLAGAGVVVAAAIGSMF